MRKKVVVSTNGLLKRRFHKDVRDLKERCEINNMILLTYEETDVGYYICVLSSHDYEIGSQWTDCSEDNENYFLSPEDYELYADMYFN